MVAGTLPERITGSLEQAAALYNRLVLVVGPAGTGKTTALREVAQAKGLPLVNVNLELSRRLLDLTEKQRALRCAQILGEIVDQADDQTVLLDNLEVLFDPSLRQDPLRLLQRLSRNRTVVATWNGEIEGAYLTYAKPGHPEHRRYQVSDFIVVDASSTS